MKTKTRPEKPAPAVAYSYLRYSSPAQTDGDSVRRQTALRVGWLKRYPHVRLDTTLVLEDRGVSGRTGEHRKNMKHALAQFLDQVERGRVAPGSYLIVENLDRFSREEFEEAVPAALGLIAAGIKIVQLSPVEMVYEQGMDEGRKIMLVMELSRGHAESERKAVLLAQAWGEKKVKARDGTPHGGACPAWLRLVGAVQTANGRWDYSKASYKTRPAAVRTVRRVYEMAARGLGVQAIILRLHKDGVPAIGRKGKWSRAYVTKLLTTRTVLGEYTPMKGPRRGPRQPDGEPIPAYFPRVISDALWEKVQRTRSGKKRHPGSRKPRSRHVLAGLVVDARDGSPMYVHAQRKVGPQFVSREAYERRPGAVWVTFPVQLLADALLSKLVELRSDALFKNPGAAKIDDLNAKLGEVERRLARARVNFDADPDSPTWSEMVTGYDRDRRKLVAELSDAKQEAAHPVSASWSEAVELMKANDPIRLRAALQRTVIDFRTLVVGRTVGKVAFVQARFREGAIRNYVVCWHYRHWSVPKDEHKAVEVVSYHGPDPKAELDLADPAHVVLVERYLSTMDPTDGLDAGLAKMVRAINDEIKGKAADLRKLKAARKRIGGAP